MGVLRLLFSFYGRIERQPYWIALIAVNVVHFAVIATFVRNPASQMPLWLKTSCLVLTLLWLVSLHALAAKRLHALGRSGGWALVFGGAVLLAILMSNLARHGVVPPQIDNLVLLLIAVVLVGGLVALGLMPSRPRSVLHPRSPDERSDIRG